MDSFEALIGKNINDVVLNESETFFVAPLEYFYKNCGMRYPASKFKLADLDYFNFIGFSELFKYESILIVWHDSTGLITDLELYHLSNELSKNHPNQVFQKLLFYFQIFGSYHSNQQHILLF